METGVESVLNQRSTFAVVQGDCLDVLRSMPNKSVDLVFGSPPYEKARLYLESGKDLGITRDTEAWVAWMVEVFKESLRVCKGLVAFVVEGQTEGFRYSCGPALLMADLHRAGIHLRKPPVYRRSGIPGSGGPDWLRNDYEFVISATSGGKLPWSDNTAMGYPPKWAPGGEMSYRNKNGTRRNAFGVDTTRPVGTRTTGDKGKGGQKARENYRAGHTMRKANGDMEQQDYVPPVLANPGNVISCKAGFGNIGNSLCHKNEAPFSEYLAAFFVRSFCPPGGVTLDPFSGSGTTGAVSVRWCRRFLGCDIRQSQVGLSLRRIELETPLALFAALGDGE